MSAPSFERRLLRPRYIRFIADRLWVIDETQPVAVLLNPSSRQIDRIVSWPEIPSPSPALTIASYGDRVWLQYRGTDVLAWVSLYGVHHAAEFIGDWPHDRLHISFTHDDYEGLTLVARLNLYDEQGQRLDDITRYVPTELMEQADTRAYPDRSHAIGGVLYV